MDFAKRDFQYCWRNTLNRDNFDSNIYFEDPISKFTNYTGECSSMHIASCFLVPIDLCCLLLHHIKSLLPAASLSLLQQLRLSLKAT